MLCWSAVAAGGDIRFWAEMPVNEQLGSPDRAAAKANSIQSRFMISAPFHWGYVSATASISFMRFSWFTAVALGS